MASSHKADFHLPCCRFRVHILSMNHNSNSAHSPPKRQTVSVSSALAAYNLNSNQRVGGWPGLTKVSDLLLKKGSHDTLQLYNNMIIGLKYHGSQACYSSSKSCELQKKAVETTQLKQWYVAQDNDIRWLVECALQLCRITHNFIVTHWCHYTLSYYQ